MCVCVCVCVRLFFVSPLSLTFSGPPLNSRAQHSVIVGF